MDYWLNAQPDAPAVFADQGAAVCAVSQQAPAFEQRGGHGIRTEEKTGIQALERAAPTWPRQPGLVERPEYAYIRHGTLCLIANVNVATGDVVAPTLGPSRTAAEFATPIAQTLTTDEVPRLFVVDPLNTHTSAALVPLVARTCGVAADLGEKEKRRVVKSLETRAALLSDASHRIRFL